jgi:hypothetical protein
MTNVNNMQCVPAAGSIEDVYRYHGLDTDSIIRAALDVCRYDGNGSSSIVDQPTGPL